MKQILIFLSLLSIISCQKKQEKYIISGQISNIPNETIIDLSIEYNDFHNRIKSDTIFNGFFEFSDTLIQKPTKMNLRIRDFENFNGSCELWVDYEPIKISGNSKYLSSWLVESNISEQKSLNRINSKTRHLSAQIDSLALLRSKNRENREYMKLIRAQMDSINQIRYLTELELIEENPNSYSAVEKLYNIIDNNENFSKDKVNLIYKNLDSIYKNTLYGEGISSILTKKETPTVGDMAVEFKAFDIEGKMAKLSDYKGKYILLDFWATHCAPCIQAIPELKQLNTKYKNDLIIIGLNIDTTRDLWIEGMKRDNVPWLNLTDGKGSISGIGFEYGIYGYPTYFLINPEGKIVEHWSGYYAGKFENKISQYLN